MNCTIKTWLLVAAVTLGLALPAAAQSVVGTNKPLSASGTTSNTALPSTNVQQYPFVMIMPALGNTVSVHYALGNSSVVATTSNPVLPNGGVCIAVGPNTTLAAITDSGSATINISQWSQCPIFSGLIPSIGGGGGGSVVSVSVATANGFAGTVANPTTVPAITVSTTVTGILQGDGTAISAAPTSGSGSVVLATSPSLVTPSILYSVRVVTAAGAISISATDYAVCINKTVGAATTANLPSSPATGTLVVVKDCKGDAATNNITVTPAAGNIDGSSTYVMSVNFQSISVIYNGTQWNIL